MGQQVPLCHCYELQSAVMRRWLPVVLFAIVTASLVAAYFLRPPDDMQVEFASSLSGDESVIVCRDSQIQQLLVPELTVRTLFADIDCTNTFRWQLNAEFDQLLTVENVDGGSHIFVRLLEDKAYDLTALMGFQSSFDQAVVQTHPRFEPAGRVTIVSGSEMLLVNPESGEYETIPMPEPLPTSEQGFRARCGVENNLLEVARSWFTQCPWGWFEVEADEALSYFAQPVSAVGAQTIVGVSVSSGQTALAELTGDLGVCATETPRVYWVESQLICVGGGIGLVLPDRDAGTFSVVGVVEPSNRTVVNVVPTGDGSSVYFTTDAVGASLGRELWNVRVGDQSEPQSLGVVTALSADGSHEPFTIFAAI